MPGAGGRSGCPARPRQERVPARPPQALLATARELSHGRVRYARTVLSAHHIVAYLVIAAAVLSAGFGFFVAWRRRRPGHLLSQIVALAQTLVVAQVAMGLILLSQHQRAADRLHYLYGALCLGAILAPWLYAPSEPRRRLLWFAGSSFVAALLAARAYMSATR